MNWNDFLEVTTKADLVVAWQRIVDGGKRRLICNFNFQVNHSLEYCVACFCRVIAWHAATLPEQVLSAALHSSEVVGYSL